MNEEKKLNKDKVLQVSVTEQLKNKLEQEAQEKNLSLSAYIRLIISERNK